MMRFQKIGIKSVLNYDDFELNFGNDEHGLHILYGPNETGKSTLLQIILDLLFGGKIADRYKKHYQSNSKIQATIQDSDSDIIQIHRKKFRNQLVLDNAGNEMTEEQVRNMLGGYDKEQFMLLFGFDHDKLREGGQSLLQSGGNAGISLFETGGGLQYLQSVLKELTEQANALLDPKFNSRSSKIINKLWKSLTEQEKLIQKSGLRGDYWQKLRNEIQTNISRKENLQAHQLKIKQEIAKLERIKRVRDFVLELDSINESLELYKNELALPDEVENWINSTVEKLKELNHVLARTKEKYAQKKEKIKSVNIDKLALNNKNDIETLYAFLSQFLTNKNEEIPKLQNQLKTNRNEAEEQLKSLAPALSMEDLDQLRIPYIDEENALILAENINKAKADVAKIYDYYEELKRETEKNEEYLASLGKPKDIRTLKWLLSEIRAKGDIDELLNKHAADIRMKEESLAHSLQNQVVWQGSLTDLQFVSIPLMETIDRFQNLWSKYENLISNIKTNIEKNQSDIRLTEQQLEQLQLQGKVPIEEDLFLAREKRNHGWNLIKHAWLKGQVDEAQIEKFAGEKHLSDAFEDSLKESDEIADLMRKESKRSAQRAQLLLRKEQLTREYHELERSLQATEEDFSEIRSEWKQEWKNEYFNLKTPLEMKEWLTNYYRPILDGLQVLNNMQLAYRELLESKQTFIQKLHEQFDILRVNFIPENDNIKPLINIAEEFIQQTDEQMNSVVNANENLQRSKIKLKDYERNLKMTKKEWQNQLSDWENLRRKYPILPDNPEIAPQYISQLRQLFQKAGDIKQIKMELDQKIESCQQYEHNAEQLAAAIKEEFHQFPSAESFIRYAKQRWERAKENFISQKQMMEEAEQLQEEIIGFEQELKQLQAEVNEYMVKYDCKDETELLAVVEKSQHLKKLQNQKTEKERLLRNAGDNLPIDQLKCEVKEISDLVYLEERLEKLNEEWKQTDLERNNINETLWKLQNEFEQYDGSMSNAADAAQKAEAYIAEIDRYWNEYLRIESAKRLLQRAIDQFREQNESTVLSRAGKYFEKLTLGRYKELQVEYEENEPFIEAALIDGSKRRVYQMSDGTRDQLFLSLRLAFIEQQFETAKPVPLIMDDILVNFDDDRTKATLEVLHGLAEKIQIIYFTHHKSVLDHAQNLSDTKNLHIHDLQIYKEAVKS